VAGPGQEVEPVRVEQVMRAGSTTSGRPISLPAGPVETVVSRYHVPSRAALPVHKHQFQRYAYVLSGTVVLTDAETRTPSVFTKGT
jgi:quercetin dioxygenase-like cupin family protein